MGRALLNQHCEYGGVRAPGGQVVWLDPGRGDEWLSYASRCTSLVVAGTQGKPVPWMGDAALRKFTGLRSLELVGSHMDIILGPDTLRGLTALTALKLVAVRTVPSFAGLSRLRVLHIRDAPQSFTEIGDGHFRGLRELETLKIHGALNLTRIDRAAFQDLVKLGAFEMSGTDLVGVRSDHKLTLWKEFDRKALERPGGSLKVVPANLFKACTQLKELGLVHMGVEELEEDALQGLGNLESLNLEANRLAGLPDGAFRGLTSLKRLYLTHNDLPVVRKSHTRDLRRLEWLRLDDNEIAALDPGFLRTMPSLEFLLLTENRITELPAGAFEGSLSLRRLDIFFNDITAIHQDALKGLQMLTHIDLSGNKLKTLEAGIFDGLTRLQRVVYEEMEAMYLSAAELATVRPPLRPGGTLTSLSPGLFRDNTALTAVRFIGNQLSTLPRDLFAGLTRLTKVDLCHNAALGGFPDGFFRDTPNMKSLYLYGTGISRLDARTFGPLRRATRLRLEDCQITSIAPDTFRGWDSLEELNLRGNALRRLKTGTFRDTTRLSTLDLSANRLTAVGDLPRHNQWKALRLSQEADKGVSNEDEDPRAHHFFHHLLRRRGRGERGGAPCVPLGGFPDAEEIAVGWAASCFQGNKGMERCLEREWAAGGRWEAVLTRAAELRVQRRLRPCEGKKKKRKGGAAGAAGASGVAAPVGPVGEQLEAPSLPGGLNSRAMPATLLLTASVLSATLAGWWHWARRSRAGRGRPKFRGRQR